MGADNRFKKLAGLAARALHCTLGSRGGGRLGILLHHRVSPEVAGVEPGPFNVTPDRFREQLKGLCERGFRFIRLSEALDAYATGSSLPARCLVLSFDDAYMSVYRHAFPVLRELGIPAVAFLATAYVDSSEPFPFDAWAQKNRARLATEDYRPLALDQCQEMAASGLCEFGAHTHTHRDLRGQYDLFQQEVAQSRAIIQQWFGREAVPFAFPYGRKHMGFSGGGMADAAWRAGVSCALTTDCELVHPAKDNPFSWGRFNCYQWDTAATIAAKLAGWYGWAPRVQVAIDRACGRAAAADREASQRDTEQVARTMAGPRPMVSPR